MPAIAFGREYFRKIRNDYANWAWAIPRELGQNCIDCGSSELRVTSSGSMLTVSNDGPVMDEATLVNKLLTMGETTKGSEGSTGGFGIAKGIIYLAQASYQIRTGSLQVNGAGGAYEIAGGSYGQIQPCTYFDGTENIIEFFSSEEVERVVRNFKRWAMFSQWDGDVIIDGEKVEIRTKKGYHRCTKSFGRIYTNNSWDNKVIVRKNGQPMFVDHHDFKKCVIVELDGDSDKVLTSNRDGLRSPFSGDLQDFLNDLAVNKRSALDDKAAPTTIDIYRGPLGVVEEVEKQVELVAAYSTNDVGHVGEIVPDGELGATTEERDEVAEVEQFEQTTSQMIRAAAKVAANHHEENVVLKIVPEKLLRYDMNLYVKNSTGMKLPECYLPGPKMSGYTKKLLKYYASSIKTALRLLGKPCTFSVGLVFDNDGCEAQYGGVDPNFGHVFYIAPVAVQAKKGTRVMKKRYKLDATGRWLIVANAIHEVTHIDHKGHDEDYSTALTNNMAVCMAKRGEFCKAW